MTAREALARIEDWARGRSLDLRHDPASGFGAVFSRCGGWRYLLWRAAHPRGRLLGMGMLNPSTADDMHDDPTIRRCRARAEQAGFPGLIVWNLFAYRATLPADLKRAGDPVGPDNDDAIALALALCPRTIVAWGNHGAHLGRDRAVLGICAGTETRLAALGTTAQGQPRHPLYLPAGTRARRWSPPAARLFQAGG